MATMLKLKEMKKPGRHLRRWTDDDIAILRAGYETNIPGAEIAVHLDRPQRDVYYKARIIGLSKRSKVLTSKIMARWSVDDDTVLTECYGKFWDTEAIAVCLGRTESSVRMRVVILGLTRDKAITSCLKWVPASTAAILEEYGPEAFKEEVAALRAKYAEEQSTRVAHANEERRAEVERLADVHLAKDMPREMHMVFLRAAGATLEEISERFGITRERVRQICNAVVRRADTGEEKNG